MWKRRHKSLNLDLQNIKSSKINFEYEKDWFQCHYLNWLQVWPPDGATSILLQICLPSGGTYISYKPGLVGGATCMYQLTISLQSGKSCISLKFGHQVAPLAFVPKLSTRLGHLHCHIGLISLHWVGSLIS